MKFNELSPNCALCALCQLLGDKDAFKQNP